tara:strand:+ start:287 stop:550 length:264 start_codon:yes stop_codon:yes gene_type:complete
MGWYSSKHAQTHNSSFHEPDCETKRVWQEWMGYRVYYIVDGLTYVQDTTSYGVSYGRAAEVMKKILLKGSCAWIAKMDPTETLEVPF